MTEPAAQTEEMVKLTEAAAALLLRSPALTLSQILELLDIGDAEFREMSRSNTRIAELLAMRRDGKLIRTEPGLEHCRACGELFVPYAGARHCSDECRAIARLDGPCRA